MKKHVDRILKTSRGPVTKHGHWDESVILKVSKTASLTEIIEEAMEQHGIAQHCGDTHYACRGSVLRYIQTARRNKRGEVYISIWCFSGRPSYTSKKAAL